MDLTIRLFGSLREALGAKELALTLPDDSTVADLATRVERDFPAFAEFEGRLRVSVNFEIVELDHALADGDEVAFLPPVSGGAVDRPSCTLSEAPLDVNEVMQRVAGPDCGGLVTFLGAVRDQSRGRDIQHLEYEAYPGMAEAEMQKIADEAAQQWPGCRVAIAHRAGHLEIGDLAVVVAAAAPHRAEAFDAARFAIDTLKERVPIWKKEIATDGEYWVEDRP